MISKVVFTSNPNGGWTWTSCQIKGGSATSSSAPRPRLWQVCWEFLQAWIVSMVNSGAWLGFVIGSVCSLWVIGLQGYRQRWGEKKRRKGAACQKARTARRQERKSGHRQVVLWLVHVRLCEIIREKWGSSSGHRLCAAKLCPPVVCVIYRAGPSMHVRLNEKGRRWDSISLKFDKVVTGPKIEPVCPVSTGVSIALSMYSINI